jgi:hypothetical protein
MVGGTIRPVLGIQPLNHLEHAIQIIAEATALLELDNKPLLRAYRYYPRSLWDWQGFSVRYLTSMILRGTLGALLVYLFIVECLVAPSR